MVRILCNECLSEPDSAWFCSVCQPDIEPQDDHTPGEYALLPPEVLEQIFVHLRGIDILQIRLVCIHWRNVVDGNFACHGRLQLRMTSKVLGEHYEPLNLYPARRAFLAECCITAVNHWWPSFGERLVELRLDDCQVKRRTLFETLRQAPNLKYIEICNLSYNMTAPNYDLYVAEPNYGLHLTKLETLMVTGDTFGFLTGFVNACGLASFRKLENVEFRKIYSHSLAAAIAVIQAAQDTLKKVGFLSAGCMSMINELKQIPRLRVKIFELGTGYGGCLSEFSGWTDFFRMQADALEELYIADPVDSTNEALHTIGQFCPNIRKISVGLDSQQEDPQEEPSPFMDVMPKLEYAFLSGPSNLGNLTNHGSRNLKQVALYDGGYSGFFKFVSRFINIQRIELVDCYVSPTELFQGIELLHESLQCLRIDYKLVMGDDQNLISQSSGFDIYQITRTLSKLTELHWKTHHFTRADLQHLLSVSPQLEICSFGIELGNDIILLLLETARQLRKLYLSRDLSSEGVLSSRVFDIIKERNIQLRIRSLSEGHKDVDTSLSWSRGGFGFNLR